MDHVASSLRPLRWQTVADIVAAILPRATGRTLRTGLRDGFFASGATPHATRPAPTLAAIRAKKPALRAIDGRHVALRPAPARSWGRANLIPATKTYWREKHWCAHAAPSSRFVIS